MNNWKEIENLKKCNTYGYEPYNNKLHYYMHLKKNNN